MAAGGAGQKSLEQTSTWAVAVVCFVLIGISLLIEHGIHLVGEWLKKKHKRALYEALEKLKSELMLLGFISLLLTVGQSKIADICIPKSVAATWHPCNTKQEAKLNKNIKLEELGRKLQMLTDSDEIVRRVLAAAPGDDKCAAKGKEDFVSSKGIHQLHIFIFVLTVFHVLYCIITLALARAKMRRWKGWERESRTAEYQFSHDPERFRFARETSFGRRHLSFWTRKPFLLWVVCFFRQFVRSVPKVDYLTLRHGFIMAHLAPQSQLKFDFQKYIKRSLEEDFKMVVGISPPIWFFAILFLLFNTHGWYSYLWLPFIPLIVILLIGTKLQVIITKMGLRIQERGEVVKGVPVVEPGDDLFWFNRPRLILYLINFVLFQNAFQLAFFCWTWYEFTLKSCFHEHVEDIVIRISMGILVQILCSYVTLPLYALVIQMGSSMKPVIFNERVATALKNWHHTAKHHVKQSNHSHSPISSRPATPSRRGNTSPTPSYQGNMSPVHLLRYYKNEVDSYQTSPRGLNNDFETWGDAVERSPSPSHHHQAGVGSTSHDHENLEDGSMFQRHQQIELGSIEHDREVDEPNYSSTITRDPRAYSVQATPEYTQQHEINTGGQKGFSFNTRASGRK